MDMNKDIAEGKWRQVKGKAKEKWGKLTDDELTRVEGNAEQLAGLVQERYGHSREQARKEVDDFFRTY